MEFIVEIGFGSLIVIVSSNVQPFKSLTLKGYVPAGTPIGVVKTFKPPKSG